MKAARMNISRSCGQLLSGLAAGLILAATPASAKKAPQQGHPVLLISIDGLRPGDVLEAEQRGLKIPNLRRFLVEGSYASGVTGVLPTLTYPSHTTLITGATPAQHGVVSNQTFDPRAINQDGWYWYASDIRVPTLWDKARLAGKTTGNVHWPVSVGAKITWNLPQIWRTGHSDDAKLVAALSTQGLLPELEKLEGSYAPGKDEDIEADENRGRFAVRMIAKHRPQLMTVYLAGLDHIEHSAGPDSAPAHAALERLDAVVGNLITAEKAAHKDAVIALVSDHGFAKVDEVLNPAQALIEAGLLRVSPPDPLGRTAITGWDAAIWASGGSFAVKLARDDEALRAQVRTILAKIAADPANKIERILERDKIAKMGGNPEADFYVNMGAGMMVTGYLKSGLPLRFPAQSKGMHGYFPDDPRMLSTYMLMGPSIPKARNLGQIDMRSIAPALAARLLGQP